MTRCKFRGRRGILYDVLQIDGSLARNIDFEVANFQVLRKTRRKTSILKLQVEEVSHEMLVLVLPRVSSRVSGYPVASPCLWGKLQNLSFCHVANCENCRKSRTKCCFFCITCLVSSRWFSCGVAVSMGEAGKHLLFECVQASCHVVLRGRCGTL